MKVLIVGGGIAGLTLGSLLQQRNVDYTIIEKNPVYNNDTNYVISLWPLGNRVLHGLNLYDRFTASSQEIMQYQVHNAGGQLLHSYDMTSFLHKYGGIYGILRSELIDLLRETAGSIKMNTTVTSLIQLHDKVRVEFSDNTHGEYDLVVGADGVHSQIRKMVWEDNFLSYLGWAGWMWSVPPDVMPANVIAEYWGNAHFFGLYPAKDKCCCYISLPQSGQIQTDSLAHKIQTIENEFKDFGGYVPEVLKRMQNVKEIYYTDFFDSYDNVWEQGRVIMIGDAGQLILPTAGVGASVAMESAAALADELSRASAHTIPFALDCYLKRHKKRVDMIQSQSRALARLMATRSAWISTMRNQLMKMYSQKMFFKTFEKVLNDPI